MGKRIWVCNELANLIEGTKKDLSDRLGLDIKESEASRIIVMKLQKDPGIIIIKKRRNSPNAKMWIK